MLHLKRLYSTAFLIAQSPLDRVVKATRRKVSVDMSADCISWTVLKPIQYLE